MNLKSEIEVQGEADSSLFSDRPIVCILEEEDPNKGLGSQEKRRCRMFKVIQSKGKALASGGFGVTIAKGGQTNSEDVTAEEEIENDSDEEQEVLPLIADEANNKRKDTTSKKSAEYLFIEEVLFLHEKGLLRALLPSKDTSTSKASQDGTNAVQAAIPLDTSQLYQLLPSLGVSLPIYRVYSHLRSQDFRVLRHDLSRYEILCQQKEDREERRRRKILRQEVAQRKEQESSEKMDPPSGERKENENVAADSQNASNPRKQSLRLRRRIRESIQHAPPPTIPTTNCIHGNSDNSENKIRICWDAYNPNSNFGKTHPGFPDFYVTVTYYNIPMAAFSDVNILLKNKCNGIPLKVATVSDSGTVVMFGVTDYGIPSLHNEVLVETKS